MSDKEYHGYKNYDTWNIVLWIDSTENLYLGAREFMLNENPDKDNPYRAFVISCGLDVQSTPDGVEYMSDTLDYVRLNQYMKEL